MIESRKQAAMLQEHMRKLQQQASYYSTGVDAYRAKLVGQYTNTATTAGEIVEVPLPEKPARGILGSLLRPAAKTGGTIA